MSERKRHNKDTCDGEHLKRRQTQKNKIGAMFSIKKEIKRERNKEQLLGDNHTKTKTEKILSRKW